MGSGGMLLQAALRARATAHGEQARSRNPAGLTFGNGDVDGVAFRADNATLVGVSPGQTFTFGSIFVSNISGHAQGSLTSATLTVQMEFSVDGDPVRWLWIIPITERSRQAAKEYGSASLVSRLAAQGRSWIVQPPATSGR